MEKFNGIEGFESRKDKINDNVVIIKPTTLINTNKLSKFLTAYGSNVICIDKDMIEADIYKLKKNIETTNNKSYIDAANDIIRYLEKLKKSSGKEIGLKLANMRRGITGIPNHLYRFTNFNIQSTDYVSVQDKAIASVKYDNVLDALALLLCREDMLIEMDDIEKGLKDYGILATYSWDVMKKFISELEDREFTDGNIYNTGLSLRIGSSDYMNFNEHIIYDYFGGKVDYESKDTYQTVLEQSASKMMQVITFEMLKHIDECGFGYRLLSVNDGLITFTLDKSVNIDEAGKMLNLAIILKVFGRKFKFNPNIKISRINN